jgi:hypothetical protein
VERLTAFYRLWCLKESYVKALGEGVTFDIKRVECVTNSDLYINKSARKHLVVSDTQLFVDNKLVRNVKFYEQYFMDYPKTNAIAEYVANVNIASLHIMTICLLGNEETNNLTTTTTTTTAEHPLNGMAEFVELTLKDLTDAIVPLEVIDDKNDEEFEDLWQKYNKKQEQPLL